MRVMLSGVAGFIGMHVALQLLQRGDVVVGVDDLNDYYDVRLKRARLACLERFPSFRFVEHDLGDFEGTKALFSDERPDTVVHLAAQAGVRYSIDNPAVYLQANLVGFGAVLEGCRAAAVRHLVFASSSSVYGSNARLPYRESDPVDHPVSLYAATKIANERMAHVYAHLYGVPVTGLRFFTVYGPWGRPDMAYWSFTEAMLTGRVIDLYDHGRNSRDFTFIDDVTTAVVKVLDTPATPDASWDAMDPDPATSDAPYRVYNVGNRTPVSVLELVRLLERHTGVAARVRNVGPQPGDVTTTLADASRLEAATGFAPTTSLSDGLERFVAWYREYTAEETST